MVREPPICPVCGLTLTATGPDPNMYHCTKRKVWDSDLNIYFDIVDATVFLDSEGKQTLKVIEVPPFSFTITDDDRKQETVIRKVVPQVRSPKDKTKARTLERKIILTIPAVVKLPWKDKKAVAERVKLYLLFS